MPVGTQSVTQVVTLTQSCAPLDLNCLGGILPSVFSPVISATGGFVPTSGCPTNLITSLLGLPQSCLIDISFVPKALGLTTGQVNTGNGGPTVSLSGTGSVGPGSGGSGSSPRPSSRKRKCKKKHKRSQATFFAKKKCKRHK